MHCRIHRSIADVRSLVPSWNELHRRSRSDNPFLTSAWTVAWLESDDSLHPFVVSVSDAAGLRAVLPLALEPGAFRRLRFVEGDMYGLLCDGSYEPVCEAIAGALAGSIRNWDVIVMSELDADAATTTAMREDFVRKGLLWSGIETSQAPFVSYRTGKQEMEARVGKKVINEIKRRQKQLERIGSVRFERVASAEGIDRYFPSVVELHERRWEDRSDTSAFADPVRLRGMRAAAHAMAALGEFAMDLMFVDDQLVAYSYGFSTGGRYVYYSPGFDPAYAPYSASKILLYRQLCDGIAAGQTEFDFSRGAEPYKLVWSTGVRRGATVIVGHESLRSRAAAASEQARYRSVVWLKSQPNAVQFKRVTLGRVRRRFEPTYWRDRWQDASTRAKRSWVDRGALGTWRWLFSRALKPVRANIRGRLYEHTLDRLDAATAEGVAFETLGPSRFAELASGGRYDVSEIVRRHYLGYRCHLALVGGRIASYAWSVAGQNVEVPELGRALELADSDVYISDCYTLPEHRGRGLYPALLRQALGDARKSKAKRALIAVAEDNLASIRGIEKAGFRLALRVDEGRWFSKAGRAEGSAPAKASAERKTRER